jgi:hypothetical protein
MNNPVFVTHRRSHTAVRLFWNCALVQPFVARNNKLQVKLNHWRKVRGLNPFQSNFSANRILPSAYLFWAGKRLVGYCNYPIVLKEKNRNRKSTLRAICWLKSILHEEKRREQENQNIGRSPILWYITPYISTHPSTLHHTSVHTPLYYTTHQYTPLYITLYCSQLILFWSSAVFKCQMERNRWLVLSKVCCYLTAHLLYTYSTLKTPQDTYRTLPAHLQ